MAADGKTGTRCGVCCDAAKWESTNSWLGSQLITDWWITISISCAAQLAESLCKELLLWNSRSLKAELIWALYEVSKRERCACTRMLLLDWPDCTKQAFLFLFFPAVCVHPEAWTTTTAVDHCHCFTSRVWPPTDWDLLFLRYLMWNWTIDKQTNITVCDLLLSPWPRLRCGVCLLTGGGCHQRGGWSSFVFADSPSGGVPVL